LHSIPVVVSLMKEPSKSFGLRLLSQPEGCATPLPQRKGCDAPARRAFLSLAAGTLCFGPARLGAWSDKRFWETEDPASWTPEQVQELTTKSPWAKSIAADPKNGVGAVPAGRSGGRGGRRGGTSSSTTGVPRFPAIIRWASARPIREALKLHLHASLAEHHVISVTGVPIAAPEADQSSSGGGDANADPYAFLKQQTTLEAHHNDAVQPGVAHQDSDDTSTIYFGFLPSLVNLADAKVATFSMDTGMLIVKTKFNLADMKYRGELAV
jgi:hypothetical protein